jgi:peptide/nickel transport system substrate-binding protein
MHNKVGNSKKWLAAGGAGVLLVSLAACGSNRDDSSSGTGGAASKGEAITIGTTDSVTALDPAGSYDLGSSTLEYNMYQTLLTIPAGETTPQGDAAESCKYDDPKTFTCTLKPGLEFSNGDALTSSDVKYSFERAIKIADPNGAATYLLGSIAKPNKDGVLQVVPSAIETPDDTTVTFHLNKPDTTFQYLITYPGAGAIVDEDVFPADKELDDSEVIGSGPYKLSQYKAGEQAVFELNSNYKGDFKGQAPQVFVSYYTEPSQLKLAIEDGDVDVAYRSLSPTDLKDLGTNDNVTVATGDGAEIRYWVWDVTSPVGKDLATRQAAAQIIDRDKIASSAYDGSVAPLYSIVPPGFGGQTDSFKAKYGEPNVAAAKKLLDDAGIKTPVNITMGYTPTHYGPNAVDEATEVERQLEDSGLFNVTTKSVEWEQYQTIYKEGAYDLWMLGWFPDYPDADDYLSPFLVDGGFFQNHYTNPKANDLVAEEQATSDKAKREAAFSQLQDIAAEDVPFIPSWVGKNVAVYGPGIKGVEQTLDPAYIFRFWLLTKNA